MVVKRRRPKPLLIWLISIALILLALGFLWMFLVSPKDASNYEEIEVVIPNGTSTKEIGKILKEKDLIHSELFFQFYVKLNNSTSLKATTYTFAKSMSLEEIVKSLEEGNSYNPDVVKITFREGERITDYAEEIAANTNHTLEEVINQMNDREYLTELISKYWFLTESILQEGIYYPLEGYLYPNTYHFENKDVEITEIIETLLKETENKLAPYKNIVGQNIHTYITMASILELEGINTTNRKMIAGIFNNRLEEGMNLGSDVTTYYALQYPMTSDLTSAQFATVNPYNTRSSTMAGKMPIGPICNPSISSIEASIEPTESDYLYFVADKNGNIYYTKTLREHEAMTQEIKDRGDWIW